MAGRDIVITDQGSVIFKEEEAGGTNGVSLKGPAATADYNIILPSAVGSGTQVINATTAGSNVTLSFATPANSGMAGINVIAYGATGNGSTDDRDAINHSTDGAIKASEGSSQASGNERIIFPAGIYILNDIDDFDGASHSYWLEGAGMGASTLKQKSGEDVLIDADGARMLVFRNMTIDGNSLANAMLQANAPYIFIDNVEFTNCSKAIKITGAPKVVAITNCRFADMEQNGDGPMIDVSGITTSGGFTFIFNDNYVEGATPGSAGTGTDGIFVSSNGTGNAARCLIRDNHFKELGDGADGAVKIQFGHDSIIEGNLFTSIVSTPINVVDSDRVRVANNRIVTLSSAIETSATVNGIRVETSAEAITDLEIVNNVIIGTAAVDVGIDVDGDSVSNHVQNVSISGNVIEGCGASIIADNIKGKVDISKNEVRAPITADVDTHKRSAVFLADVAGDTSLTISENVFTGGSDSCRAIYFSRSASSVAGTVHVVLKDNFVDSMGQDASVWTAAKAADMALIYISGHASDDRINTFDASGNRYDFTSSLAGSYGLYVRYIKTTCTFDSVLEFGAVGDGSTNCTMAINRAGLAAGVGGRVYIPSGTFDVSDFGTAENAAVTASVSATNTCIAAVSSGQLWYGEGTIHDSASSSDDEVFKSSGTDPVTIRGLTFTHEGGTNTGSAITVTGDDSVVDGVTITGFKYGIKVSKPRCRISSCDILNCVVGGAIFSTTAASTDAIISDNIIRDTGSMVVDADIGIQGPFVRGIIKNNSISNIGGYAIQLDQSGGGNPTSLGVVVEGNIISEVGRNGICTLTTTVLERATINGNSIIRADATVVATYADIYMNSVDDSSFVGNNCTSPQSKLEFDASIKRSSISGNTLINNDASPNAAIAIDISTGNSASDSVTVTGNVIVSESAATGAAIHTAGDDGVISSNIIRNYDVGISLGATAERNTLIGNVMKDVTTRLSDSGSSTIDFVNEVDRLNITQLRSQWLMTGTDSTTYPTAVTITDGTGDGQAQLDATGSFMVITGNASDTNLFKILINGNDTLTTANGGNDADALACRDFNGALLFLKCEGGNNIDILDMGAGTKPAGSNIVTHAAVNMDVEGSGAILRFQHNGTQGYWRPINPLSSV